MGLLVQIWNGKVQNGLVLGSHGGDAENLTSMSSGSGDGEAKSEVEESMLRRRLHGVEGFGSTG